MDIVRHEEPGNHGVGHPFGYDPYEDRLVIGGPGTFHNEIPDMPSENILRGRVGPSNLAFYDAYSEEHPDDIEDWKKHLREVLKAQHQARPFEDTPGQFDWTVADMDTNPGWADDENEQLQWKFGSTQFRHIPWDGGHADTTSYGGRTPFLYHPPTDTFVLGHPGQYHEGLIDAAGFSETDVGYGSVYHDHVDHPTEEPVNYHSLDDYSDAGDWVRTELWPDMEEDEMVTRIPGTSLEALRNHLGMKPGPENDWEYDPRDFKFGKGKLGSAIKTPQNASQKLSAPSRVYVDDKGIPVGSDNRMRKFIYTPFDQSVTLNGDGEWFHRNIYKNKYNRNWTHGDIGTNVFTGHIYPDNSVHWIQWPSDEERQLVNDSLGGTDFNHSWTFGKTALYGPPEIKVHDYDIMDPTRVGEYDPKRTPFLYEGATNTVHIGPKGGYHQDLANFARIPYKNAGGVLHGNDDSPYDVAAYGALPPQVLDAVRDWAGISENPNSSGSGLKFGWKKKTSHDLQWEPGGLGKGWVFDDGSVWTWPVDEDTLRPFHRDKLAMARPQGLEPMYQTEGDVVRSSGAFYINPEGQIVQGGKEVPQKFALHILKADPRLSNPYQDEWKFAP